MTRALSDRGRREGAVSRDVCRCYKSRVVVECEINGGTKTGI
ncbi:MAG: hypothetical protein QW434_09735 [Pyrobaculum sp.]